MYEQFYELNETFGFPTTLCATILMTILIIICKQQQPKPGQLPPRKKKPPTINQYESRVCNKTELNTGDDDPDLKSFGVNMNNASSPAVE